MRDGEISKCISMEKGTFRKLSFYSYLNDVKGKSGGEIHLLLFFQWTVNNIVKKF